MLDFFAALQVKAVRLPKAKSTLLETTETIQFSKTLASLDAVTPDWMGLWIQQWFSGKAT